MTELERLYLNIGQVNSDFSAIKEEIKKVGVDVSDGTPTSEYASKITSVHEAGQVAINNEVVRTNDSLEATLYGTDVGGKSWYDAFWDTFQQNGNRTNYNRAFFSEVMAQSSWNDDNYNPKYPIVTTVATQTFWCAMITDTKVSITLGDNCNALTMFGSCTNLKTIRKLILEGTVSTWSNAFISCNALTDIVFEGVIDKDINFQWSTLLSRASIENIVGHLSETVTGQTLTLSDTAVTNAFTEEEWETLIAPYDNWTISRV